MTGSISPQKPHLVAAILASLIASVALAASLFYCRQVEQRYIHAIAPEFSTAKLQGVALQKLAFGQADLLLLYGSSELLQDLPTNASRFFADYPSGFRVFPVGKPGTTALAVLQKVASMGKALRGRKFAYSISPGFYFTEVFDPKYYEGNFSELQAGEFAFSSPLSAELKREVARRMLTFPRTLQDRPLLELALRKLASEDTVDRWIYAAILPVGRLQNAIGRAQDHFQAALGILDNEKLEETPERRREPPNWSNVLRKAAQFVSAAQMQSKTKELAKRRLPKASRDRAFLDAVAKAREWTDLELLMRTFTEMGAEPLLLAMPIEDVRLEASGLSPSSREAFVDRLDKMADRYDLPLLDFREHETDPSFLADFSDHLSGKGWLYYNKALDDFYHDRLPSL